MKQWLRILSVTLFLLVIGASSGLAETLEVRLRIRNDKSDEIILKRENLVRIKEFMLQQGKRETYCNRYNHNPAYHTANYDFYLNPDTGPQNINCDPSKSDFQTMTIHVSAAAGNKNQYRRVEFADPQELGIVASWPSEDLTISGIRAVVVDALKEILAAIEKRTPNHAVEPNRAPEGARGSP